MWLCLLELCRERQQDLLARRGAHQLDGGRQPVLAVVNRLAMRRGKLYTHFMLRETLGRVCLVLLLAGPVFSPAASVPARSASRG